MLSTDLAGAVLHSRNKHLQDIILNPIRPMVALIGPISCTVWIKKILYDHLRVLWQGQLSSNQALSQSDMPETSKYHLKVKKYEYYSEYRSPESPNSTLEMPSFYKEQGASSGLFRKNPHSQEGQDGYIKKHFFSSVTHFKPAVTIMVFDWQQQGLGSFDWRQCE